MLLEADWCSKQKNWFLFVYFVCFLFLSLSSVIIFFLYFCVFTLFFSFLVFVYVFVLLLSMLINSYRLSINPRWTREHYEGSVIWQGVGKEVLLDASGGNPSTRRKSDSGRDALGIVVYLICSASVYILSYTPTHPFPRLPPSSLLSLLCVCETRTRTLYTYVHDSLPLLSLSHAHTSSPSLLHLSMMSLSLLTSHHPLPFSQSPLFRSRPYIPRRQDPGLQQQQHPQVQQNSCRTDPSATSGASDAPVCCVSSGCNLSGVSIQAISPTSSCPASLPCPSKHLVCFTCRQLIA